MEKYLLNSIANSTDIAQSMKSNTLAMALHIVASVSKKEPHIG